MFWLDDTPVTAAPPQPAAFSVILPSKPYIEELQRCWADPNVVSHHTSHGRNLAAMQEAGSYGLDRMAPVDPTIASLIVSPDEALRLDARCPRPQCRLTDDLLVRAYNIAACMGWVGNPFSRLILGLSQVLQESGVDSSAQTLSDASLQTFAFMSRELGRLMSAVTLAGAVLSIRRVFSYSLFSSCGSRSHVWTSCAVLKWTRPGSGLLACIRARLRSLGRWVSCHLVPAPLFHLLAQVHSRGKRRWTSSRPFFQLPRGQAPVGHPPKGSRGRGGGG